MWKIPDLDSIVLPLHTKHIYSKATTEQKLESSEKLYIINYKIYIF